MRSHTFFRPVNHLRDEQQVAVGLSGDRITKARIRSIECADAVLFVMAERGSSSPASRSIARDDVLVNHDDVVGVVVDRRQPSGLLIDQRNADAERPSLSRIDIELADEPA